MHNKRSLRCHVAVTHTLLQVTSAMGVNEQLLLSELRQTRADVNSGPHRLIAHPVMPCGMTSFPVSALIVPLSRQPSLTDCQ